MSMGFTVTGFRAQAAYATPPTLAEFPLRYREETSIIILDSRTSEKS
jgi:hypothetical protein